MVQKIDIATGVPIVPIEVTGSNVKEAWSGSTNTNRTLTGTMKGITITNDGASDLTFVINGITITVKSTEVWSGKFSPFTSVNITTTSAYRAYVTD